MKILYIVHQFYPDFYTGTEKFIFNLAHIMQKQSIRVFVLTYDIKYRDTQIDKTNNQKIILKKYMYKGIEVISFRENPIPIELDFIIKDLPTNYSLELLKEIKPDLVHVGHPMRLTEFIRAAYDLGIPCILTLTDFWLQCYRGILLTLNNKICDGPNNGKNCIKRCPTVSPESIITRYQNALSLLNKASLLVSPSKFLAKVFMHNIPSLSVKVINHGMRYSFVEINDRLYNKNEGLTFCYAGSLNHHKGVHLLIKAFKEIPQNNLKLKIYGSSFDKGYEDHLHELAGDDPRIEFCGVFNEDEFGRVLKEIDVLVVPSIWYENYPLILHEALACGVPIVASNIGGMAEKIKDNYNGFLFQVNNVASLRNVLTKITENPELLNPIKKNIRKMFIPTLEQEAYAYLKEYKKILSSN